MIQIDDRLCSACGACVDVCPRQAIRIVDGGAVVDSAACDDCGQCVPVCPRDAILWVDVFAPETSGGSVTVCEPVSIATTSWMPTRAAAVWPLVGSALLWAGREIVPRVADLALDVLVRRASRSTAPRDAAIASGLSAGGRRRRQRQRKKGVHQAVR